MKDRREPTSRALRNIARRWPAPARCLTGRICGPSELNLLLGRIYLNRRGWTAGQTSFQTVPAFFLGKEYGADLTGQRLSELEAAGPSRCLRGGYDTVREDTPAAFFNPAN